MDEMQAKYDELNVLIKEKQQAYGRALDSNVNFYELKKLRAEIVALGKELEVLGKHLHDGK